MAISIRPLGWHERFSITRTNIGSPAVVCIQATLGADLHTARASIEARLTEVLEGVPHLSCRVVGSRTETPEWVARASPLSSADVLFLPSSTVTSKEATESRENRTARLLLQETAALARQNIEDGPLFRVALHPCPENDGCQVVLTTNHVLADGKGCLALFEALLSSSPLGPAQLGSWPANSIPAASDVVLPMKPSLSYLLPVIWREILLPKLPSSLASWFAGPPAWPRASEIARNPLECPTSAKVLYFRDNSQLVQELKAVGKGIGIPTLHGVLHAAALAALWASLPEDAISHERTLKIGNPVSLRDGQDPKHGRITGNFVGTFDSELPTSAITPLWTAAQRFATESSSPWAKQTAPYGIGMLSLVSTTPPAADSPHAGLTSWDAHFLTAARSSLPYTSAMELSNLGAFTSESDTTLGIRDVCWIQNPTPMSAALDLNIIGAQGRLAVVVGYRQGAVDEEIVHRFVHCFDKMIRLLAASDQEIIAARVTFGQIRNILLQEK